MILIKVYWDLLIILNFFLDFILLLGLSIVLKRNVPIKRILMGSLVGGLSLFFLFIKTNSFLLLIIKFLISLIMVVVSFGYKNIKYLLNNLLYLYMLSIILGGFLYLLRVEFSYKNEGLIFFDNGLSINFIVLIIISPIIIYIYIRENKKMKNHYSNYYKVDLYYKNRIYKFNALLDTGNKLRDQYKNRPITLVYTKKIKFNYEGGILVPYLTANGNGILRCIVVDKFVINDKYIVDRPVVGLIGEPLNIDGVDMIVSSEIIGGIYD